MQNDDASSKMSFRSLQRLRKDEALIDVILELRQEIKELRAEVAQLSDRDDTRRRLSEAGKKSAAARKSKFGSARPSTANGVPMFSGDGKNVIGTVIIDDPSFFPKIQPALSIGYEPLREPVRKAKKKVDGPTPGSLVWDSYREAFINRHKVEPLRNARVNKFCSDLVAQIGGERAREIVAYYVSRNDAIYLKAKHPLGMLVMHLQQINVEFQTGQEMTGREAARAENAAMNDRVVRQYAATQDSFSEPVREQVR